MCDWKKIGPAVGEKKAKWDALKSQQRIREMVYHRLRMTRQNGTRAADKKSGNKVYLILIFDKCSIAR